MATAIDICNIALGYLGLSPINSLSGNSENARICNLYYDLTRKELLEALNWSFAQRTELLTLTTDKVDGWKYVYGYPSNCLKIISIYPDGYENYDYLNPYDFVVLTNNSNNKIIATNCENARAKYTIDLSDTNLFSNLFIDALSLFLATKICMPLTSDQNKLGAMNSLFSHILSVASASSSSESNVKKIPEKSKYIDSR